MGDLAHHGLRRQRSKSALFIETGSQIMPNRRHLMRCVVAALQKYANKSIFKGVASMLQSKIHYPEQGGNKVSSRGCPEAIPD